MSGNFVRERQRIVYIYNIHKVGNLIIFRTQKFDITMLYSSKQPNTADERTKV